MRKSGMGNIAGWRRFSSEMHGMRTSDYGGAQTGGKKCQSSEKEGSVVKFVIKA